MGNERLQSTLRQLHDELTRAEGVHPETLDQLRKLTDEIERAIQNRESRSPDDVEAHASGLKDLLLKFEAEHPQLSVAAGRVADALAAMGI
jgi:predicted RND superfamily exporter protein